MNNTQDKSRELSDEEMFCVEENRQLAHDERTKDAAPLWCLRIKVLLAIIDRLSSTPPAEPSAERADFGVGFDAGVQYEQARAKASMAHHIAPVSESELVEIMHKKLRLVAKPDSGCDVCGEALLWKVKDGCIEEVARTIVARFGVSKVVTTTPASVERTAGDMRLVPVEATDTMMNGGVSAGRKAMKPDKHLPEPGYNQVRAIYRAMLEAAPVNEQEKK